MGPLMIHFEIALHVCMDSLESQLSKKGMIEMRIGRVTWGLVPQGQGQGQGQLLSLQWCFRNHSWLLGLFLRAACGLQSGHSC